MQAGLMNTYEHPVSSRQGVAWACSAVLIAAYVLLYFGGNPHRGFAGAGAFEDGANGAEVFDRAGQVGMARPRAL